MPKQEHLGLYLLDHQLSVIQLMGTNFVVKISHQVFLYSYVSRFKIFFIVEHVPVITCGSINLGHKVYTLTFGPS